MIYIVIKGNFKFKSINNNAIKTIKQKARSLQRKSDLHNPNLFPISECVKELRLIENI